MQEIHSEPGDSAFVWRPTIAELARALPHHLGRLSPTRAGLLKDQIQELLQDQSNQQLICIAAGGGTPDLADSVIAIAVMTAGSDTASILHVDWAYPASLHQRSHSTVGQGPVSVAQGVSKPRAAAIWQEMEAVFSMPGVRFVQWATDPVSPRVLDPESIPIPAAATCWPAALNFTPIGTLEYLFLDLVAGDASEKREREGHGGLMDPEHHRVRFHPLDPTSETKTLAFENLVERIYVNSLDCLPLGQFRTASEIIQNYREAETYAPELWFTVEAVGESARAADAIGCAVLARHPGPSARNPQTINPACVVELVYMGIVPEHRGHDYGQLVMETILEICQQQGAERLILAVDETNVPAIAAYRRFGMLHLFRETMWGRCV